METLIAGIFFTFVSIMFLGTGRALSNESSFTGLKNKFINNEEVSPFLRLYFFWFMVFPRQWDLNLALLGEKGCSIFYLKIGGWMGKIGGILGLAMGMVLTITAIIQMLT